MLQQRCTKHWLRSIPSLKEELKPCGTHFAKKKVTRKCNRMNNATALGTKKKERLHTKNDIPTKF